MWGISVHRGKKGGGPRASPIPSFVGLVGLVCPSAWEGLGFLSSPVPHHHHGS
jgi:hypothetical protein